MPYLSPVRSEQARATRRAIVTAAAELFGTQGFAATTIDAIADRAGVGRKTVFASVGGKGALLKLAWDWALAGDDEPLPMAERSAVQAILAERDPHRLVAMWTDLLLDVGTRALPIESVVLAAADVDPEARELLEAIRRETLAGATAFVTHLAGAGGLRPDLSVERAADACWGLMNSLLQHLLITERGWPTDEYRAWFVRLATATLLDPGLAAPAPPSIAVRDVPAESHYDAFIDGRRVGRLEYEDGVRFRVLLRTEVENGSEEAAATLVRRALDDVRAAGARRVVPACPYAGWWIGRHPEYADLLADPRREIR